MTTELMPSRVPPKSIEAEERIIGAILVHAERALDKVSDSLTIENFASSDYGQIFDVMRKRRLRGVPVDNMPGIVDDLKSWSHEDQVHWARVLNASLDYACPFEHVEENAELIRQKAERRKLIYQLSDTVANLYDESQPIETILSKASESLTTVNRITQFETLTSRELDEGDFALEYLIPGLLVAGQPCILAGPKKCLKTNILIDLTLSLASGCRFLNEFYVSRSVRVALISGESGQATIQETARRIAKTKLWINLADYENAFWCFDLPKLGQPNSVTSIVRYVQKHKLELLIIDPAYLAMPLGESASNLFLVGAMLQDLTRVSSETGVTIVLCHHARKGGLTQYDPPELENISWAGFQEWARQWLLLGRREAYDPDSGGHHDLWLASGGSAGHSGLWAVDIKEGTRQDERGRHWEVMVNRPADVRKQEADAKSEEREEREREHQSRNREKLLAAYELFPNGETAKALRESAGLSGTKFGPINAELLREGLIESCSITKNKKTFDAFRLVSPGQRDSAGQNPISPGCPVESRCERDSISPLGDASRPAHPHPDSQFPSLKDCDVF